VNKIMVDGLIRDMNELELAQSQIDQAETALLVKEQEEKKLAREALLTRLGITAEEAQLLLGGI
jgi:hypothetical protein